jgi:hypothetical protein
MTYICYCRCTIPILHINLKKNHANRNMEKSNTSILRLIFLHIQFKHITFQITQKIHKFIHHINISFIKHMLIITQLIFGLI